MSESNKTLKSSYNTANLSYQHMFTTMVATVRPKLIVEFGILNGYSLKAFADAVDKERCKIDAYDIFEKFEGNGAKKDVITDMFKDYDNIKIDELDFYHGYKKYDDGSIDILHIDIANTGDVYKFCIEKYLDKISSNGIIVLEGGSAERDEVSWMQKYNKTLIVPYLNKLKRERNDLIIHVLDVFPSMTIVSRKRSS